MAKRTAPPNTPAVQDVTDQFRDYHRGVSTRAPGFTTPFDLSSRKLIWVPGFISRHIENYSNSLLERFEDMGTTRLPVFINTDTGTAANLERITAAIVGSENDETILVGHSRGGIMALDSYRRLSAADKKKVSRIILLQAPVMGSPVADFVLRHPHIQLQVAWLAIALWGTDITPTLKELSQKGRKAAHDSLPALTKLDLEKIYSLRSIIGKRKSPSMEIGRWIIERAGEESDGLTPYATSAIAGAKDVTLRGYDHEMSVLQEPDIFKILSGYKPSKEYHSGDVIEAMLRLAYANVEQPKRAA